MQGDNSISKIYKDILQSRLCPCCLEASSGPRTKVPTNNRRGQGSRPCLLWRGLDKSRHIVPTALLVRVQCFRKDLYKAVEGPSTRPMVLSMIPGSSENYLIAPNILKVPVQAWIWLLYFVFHTSTIISFNFIIYLRSFLAIREECLGSSCHSPTVGVGVGVRVGFGCVDKNFNLGHNFQTIKDRDFICVFLMTRPFTWYCTFLATRDECPGS